ncbi:Cytochrome P450 [Drechmeria coniospora]|uniref:Cytochrome P450 n=1 Tax=Drechmeria coniospora TaxID=98403 RepID=A0A151GKH7_DRECN|nr:Cytochrome P450 [Drechmeria coniospora]KYK57607.1 Cytochrome P450 [Drechmeria coniospora]
MNNSHLFSPSSPLPRPAGATFHDLYLLVPAFTTILLLSLSGSARMAAGGNRSRPRLAAASSRSSARTGLPHVSSAIPWVGHALKLHRDGGRYVDGLIRKTRQPIFSIDVLSKRLLVIDPSLDRVLAKHARHTSLIQLIALVGRRALHLGDKAIRILNEYDPRPFHAHALSSPQGSLELAEASVSYLGERFGKQPRVQEVPLGRWLFEMVACATARAVWGPENPWAEDGEFMDQFIILSDEFESLCRPLPSITARAAYRARELVVGKLVAFHRAHRSARMSSLAHRTNAIYINDADWETNLDYYKFELIEALGLLPTASTVSVWLVRYLLVNDELRRKVVDEIRQLKATTGEDAGRGSALGHLEMSNIRETCPHLVAAWHETMRLCMTMVPRVASSDFTLTLPPSCAYPCPPVAGPISIFKHDVVLLPMLSFNLDPKTWGPDAESFRAERFLDDSGRLRCQLTQKVRGFGVAGNLCPGRRFGSETALLTVATLLRDFDVESATGAPFPPPPRREAMNFGFDRLGDEVQARLVRIR